MRKLGTTSYVKLGWTVVLSLVQVHLQEAKPNTGLHELSLLAGLIKPNATKASNFKLNLFGDTSLPAEAPPGQPLPVTNKHICFQWLPIGNEHLSRNSCDCWLTPCTGYTESVFPTLQIRNQLAVR